MEHEQEICPKCGSDGLTYGDTKKQDIAIGYLYECESCGFNGIEWYNLHFTEHTAPDCVVVTDSDVKSSDQTVEPKKDYSNTRPHIIIYISGGALNSVISTDPNISVTLADKDNVGTEEDEAEYNRLVSLSENDGYTEIIY